MVFQERHLRDFSAAGYDKGRSMLVQALWFASSNLLFMRWWCPARLRPVILRAFGASIGKEVFIRHGVRVLWPWKLAVGDSCWIGEGVWFLNLERICIQHDVCLSQDVYLIAGSHDRLSPSMEYKNRPINVGESAWIAVRATVLAGVNIGRGAVVGAGVVVARDVPEGALLGLQQALFRQGESPDAAR